MSTTYLMATAAIGAGGVGIWIRTTALPALRARLASPDAESRRRGHLVVGRTPKGEPIYRGPQWQALIEQADREIEQERLQGSHHTAAQRQKEMST